MVRFLLQPCFIFLFSMNAWSSDSLLESLSDTQVQIKSKIENLLGEYPLNLELTHHRRCARLIDLIKISDKNTPIENPFLYKTNLPENPIKAYKKFSRSIKHMTYKTHDLIWAHLGGWFLSLALRPLNEDDLRIANIYFFDELNQRLSPGRTNYRWFTLWVDRLTILMTPEDERTNFHGFNDYLVRDKAIRSQTHLGLEPIWLVHASYKSSINHQGNVFLRKFLSLNAVAVRQFPHIVCLPYPFVLTAYDMLQTMPIPKGSGFCPLGLAFQSVPFLKSDVSTPAIFYSQHAQNLANLLVPLLNICVAYPNDLKGNQQFPMDLLINTRKNYYTLIAACKKIIMKLENPSEQNLYSFFAFHILMESTVNGDDKFDSLADQYGQFLEDNSSGMGLDYNYFGPPLPVEYDDVADIDALKTKLTTHEEFFRKLLNPQYAKTYKSFKLESSAPKFTYLDSNTIFKRNPNVIPRSTTSLSSLNLADEYSLIDITQEQIIREVGPNIKQLIAGNSIFELDPAKIILIEYVGTFNR